MSINSVKNAAQVESKGGDGAKIRSKSSIIVLGMHRSGTSALTRVLNLGGAELPEDLTEAIPGNNEKGFFESRKLLRTNIRILKTLQVEWWSTEPIGPKRLDASSLEEHRREIRYYLTEHTRNRTVFLMKDPRMCRLFPIWEGVLREQRFGIGVVLVLRDPRAVAASLRERDSIPLDHGWLLWLRHMLEAERSSRGQHRSIVAYERLLDDWASVADDVTRSMKPVWEADWSNSGEEVSAFLEARLDHFGNACKDMDLPPLVDEAYGVFAAMENGAIGDREARVLLDKIWSRLNTADELVGPGLAYTSRQYFQLKLESDGYRAASQEADDPQADRNSAREKLSDLRQMLEEKERANKALQAKNKSTQRALENAQPQRDEKDAALRHALTECDSLFRDLERERKRRIESDTLLREERAKRERQKQECDALKASLASTQDELKTVIRYQTAFSPRNSTDNDGIKSRTNLAEQALRQEIFDHLPSVSGNFNVWIRARDEIARNDSSDLWGLTFGAADSDRWREPSSGVIRRCASELVRRGLFDIDYHVAESGATSMTRGGVVRRYLTGGWRSGVDPLPLFDSEYYCRQAFDKSLDAAPGCPLLHYLLFGSRDGLPPHPLFDPVWYKSQLPSEIREQVEPLSHYLNRGWRHNLDPHWAFCVHWYLYRNDDVRKAGAEPLTHFLSHGDREGRSPHPFISIDWYRRGLDTDSRNTLVHLVDEGIAAGRSPHPLVDTEYMTTRLGRGVNWFRTLVDARGDVRPNHLFSYAHYLRLNPDVTVNPLVHYIEFGWRERRKPHNLFDASYYALKENLSVSDDPLADYLGRKPSLRRSAHPMFDDAWYRERYPDLEGSCYGLFDHFVLHGGREGRNPSPEFDSRHYMSQVDLPEGWNPLEHYLFIGKLLRIPPKPDSAVWSVPGWSWLRGGVKPHRDRPAVLLVAHVATGNLFGSERSFLDMVEGLHGTGLVDVVVTLPQEDPGYVSRILPFVTGIYIGHYPWWDAARPPDEAVVEGFERVLEAEEAIQVVHVNTMMLREPLIAAKRAGRKTVVHVREIIDQDQHLQNRIGLSWQEAIAAQHELAGYFICNSHATRRLYPESSFVVPNTIDVARFEAEVKRAESMLSEDEKRPNLVYVGMISSNLEKKGIGDFIELARSIPSVSPLRFILVGPYTNDLEGHLANGTPDNLYCTGYIEQAAEAIARLDVIVNFSHFAESFGRTVLEGMAAAKPALVYDFGAVPDLVEDGESGYVVPFREFRSAKPLLEELAADGALRKRLGARGRDIALSKYDKHCYVVLMREAYDEILDPPTCKHADSGIEPAPRAIESSERKSAGTDTEAITSALTSHDISAAQVFPARFERTPADTPLRIAYFQWHFPVPSETFVLNELRSLVAEGYDVEVFCRQSPYPDFKPDFPISWNRIDTPDDLAEALEHSKRNIVHSHFAYPTVTEMVWPACQRSGAKFTFCAHAQDIFKYENDERNRIGEVVSSPECLAVFVAGRFHFEYLIARGVPAGKIVINPQGIDTNLYPPVDPRHVARTNRRLSAVHRFTEKKGLEYVIRAAPRLAELGVEVELWGYGEAAESYRELIRETGADIVTIHEGVIDREAMIQIFESSDMFLAPSVRAESGDMDGIPTVVMEAMMCGLPVLTTDVSSLPELVIDGHTGMVCSPRDADSLAAAVERFYLMPDVEVERMIEAAEAHVRDRFDVARVMRMAERVWQQARLDVVIVTWNNLPELQEVVTRLYRYTHFPFHLLICDNDSEKDVTDWLEAQHAQHDNITLINKGRNSFVGPGTNTAAAFGEGEFVVYICGKEGFITQPWWDSAVVNYMAENPEVGLAGTLCYSPSYVRGRDYPEGVPEWLNFRNQSFAVRNPDRRFCHVQGGFFAMRRAMLDEIGGFSDDVPHSYTDVEFSYYVESCGWKLGEIPHILSLFNKTRPNIEARYDELIYATHPPMMGDRTWIDAIAGRKVRACNLCKATWARANQTDRCKGCGATDLDRTLYKALAESQLMYRRLPALGTDIQGIMAEIWKKSFQGSIRDSTSLMAEFEANRNARINHGSGSLKFVLLRACHDNEHIPKTFFEEVRRIISDDGELWLQWGCMAGPDHLVSKSWADVGFEYVAKKRFASSVVPYCPGDLWQMKPI